MTKRRKVGRGEEESWGRGPEGGKGDKWNSWPSTFLLPPRKHPACAFVASRAGLQSHANPACWLSGGPLGRTLQEPQMPPTPGLSPS